MYYSYAPLRRGLADPWACNNDVDPSSDVLWVPLAAPLEC